MLTTALKTCWQCPAHSEDNFVLSTLSCFLLWNIQAIRCLKCVLNILEVWIQDLSSSLAAKVWFIDFYDAVLSCHRFISGLKSVTWWLQGAEYVGTILQYTSKGGFRFWLFKKKFIFFSWILYPFTHSYVFSLQNYKMVLLLKRLFSLKCKELKDL